MTGKYWFKKVRQPFFHFDEAFLTVAFPGHFFKSGFRLVLYDQSMNRTAAGKQQTKKGA